MCVGVWPFAFLSCSCFLRDPNGIKFGGMCAILSKCVPFLMALVPIIKHGIDADSGGSVAR